MLPILLLLLLQPAQPWVDCSLLTPEQRRGLPCAPVAPPPPPPPPPAGCEPFPDPYREPELAAACAAAKRRLAPPPNLPVYLVGVTYQAGYVDDQMVVLSVTPALEGVPVVTAQVIRHPTTPIGTVFAFRITDLTRPWTPVPRAAVGH